MRFRPQLGIAPEWALAAALGGFVLVSTLWSPDAGLTLGRGVSFVALLAAGVALAGATRADARAVGQLLLAVLAAAAAVAIGGALEVWNAPERALVEATIGSPVRYNGLGGNPNTMAMLMALALPLAAWALAEARTRIGKAAAAGAFLAFIGSIVASGSRGALAGAGVGLLVVALVVAESRRTRALAGLGVVALVAGSFGIMQLPPNGERDPPEPSKFGSLRPAPLGARDAQFLLPLENEIGYPSPGDPRVKRGLFETSGRTVAWRGALEQAAQRPLLGFGFGTEEEVFVDRYYLLLSSRPENSYVGTVLQLGIVGSLLVLAPVVVVLVRARRTLALERRSRRAGGACLGVVACGLAIAVTQSFVTSVGSPIAAPFWLCAFLLGATVWTQPGDRTPASERAIGTRQSATNASKRPRTGIAKRASA